MGKTKMDDAAAERIRRARGDKDSFSKRASDAARRNEGQSHRASSSSSGGSGGGGGGGSSSKSEHHKSGTGKK